MNFMPSIYTISVSWSHFVVQCVWRHRVLCTPSLILANLFQLAWISLLASFSDNSNPVKSCLITIPISVDHEYDQACDVLEVDKAQVNLCRTARSVPIMTRKFDLLSCRTIVGFIEAQYLCTVLVDLYGFGPQGDIVRFIRSRSEGSQV